MEVQPQFEMLADAAWQARETFIRPTFASWRNAARLLLRNEVPPQHVAWREASSATTGGGGARRGTPRHVPKAFLRLAATVACHRDAARWDVLYRVLWRLVHGERDLLRRTGDPDTARLLTMDRDVRRAQQRMFATLRFQGVESAPSFADLLQGDGSGHETGVTYVAWCEPAHNVVERAAPLLVKRFGDMRWSILSPDACAHWNGLTLRFTPGLPEAPTAADITGVLQRGFTGLFTPSRVSISPMRIRQQASFEPVDGGADTSRGPSRAFLGRRSMLSRLARGASHDLARNTAGVRRTPAVTSALLANEIGDDLDVPGAWDPVHDPGALAARARAAAVRLHAAEGLTLFGAPVRIGTASWCDPTIVQPGVFYPDDVCTPDARLQYYAERHALAEVESTFHTPPSRTMAAAWAARSPEGFVFDVRAFALMTGHAADTRVLPDWLREAVPESALAAGSVSPHKLPDAVLAEVWQRFVHGVAPLRDAGKLGPILLQFPRAFAPSRESADELASVRERLGDLPAAVEFRNPAWVTGRAAARTFALLEELRLTYTIVDTPQGAPSSMPPVLRVTTPELIVVRLHGRRKSTWEAGHAITSERRRYLYDRDELTEWAQRVMELAGKVRGIPLGFAAKAEAAQGVHVIQNNCHANYAATNADELAELLIELDCERLEL